MPGITFRMAWRKADPELERDAKEFWSRPDTRLPRHADPDSRARELCTVAYRDGRIVGVSTAQIAHVARLRCRMAVYRCAVTRGFLTLPPLSWSITDYSRKTLEQWSLENPGEKVMGLFAVLQAKAFIERCPQAVGPANMVLIGFNPAGFPVRVAWFKHAAIPTEWPPRPSDDQDAPRQRPAGGTFPIDHYPKAPKGEPA